MSHDLEMNENGEASMAYAGEAPWHNLGKRVPGDLSPQQMLETADLDWSVSKNPVFADLAGGRSVEIEDRMALIRDKDNKVLDIVGEDWQPLQNREAFEFFQEFIEEGGMSMHTAGSLDGGRLVWALAKVNRAFEPVRGDVVEQFLLFTNPHKYGKSIDVRFSPIRVVCNNTLTMALRQYSQDAVKVNHRQRFNAESVKETLGIANSKFDEYEEAASFLATRSYDQKTLEQYVKEIFPTGSKKKDISRPGETALEYVEAQPGANYASGTWWNAFNTVTYVVDHILGNSQETRLRSAWYGVNANKKNVALQKALEFAES